MNKDTIKNFIVILSIVVVLILLTYYNQFYIKNTDVTYSELYKNELATKILNNDIDDVDYEYLNKDLTNIDDILKEQISLDIDMVKKTEYYNIAQNIYSKKINELVRILNDKLDDEDFNRLQLDIEDFQKNIDFAITDIKNTLDSTVDIKYYTNKYLYEEKRKKSREILETYKGFLQ